MLIRGLGLPIILICEIVSDDSDDDEFEIVNY